MVVGGTVVATGGAVVVGATVGGTVVVGDTVVARSGIVEVGATRVGGSRPPLGTVVVVESNAGGVVVDDVGSNPPPGRVVGAALTATDGDEEAPCGQGQQPAEGELH